MRKHGVGYKNAPLQSEIFQIAKEKAKKMQLRRNFNTPNQGKNWRFAPALIDSPSFHFPIHTDLVVIVIVIVIVIVVVIVIVIVILVAIVIVIVIVIIVIVALFFVEEAPFIVQNLL